jgi:hypothetical protein
VLVKIGVFFSLIMFCQLAGAFSCILSNHWMQTNSSNIVISYLSLLSYRLTTVHQPNRTCDIFNLFCYLLISWIKPCQINLSISNHYITWLAYDVVTWLAAKQNYVYMLFICLISEKVKAEARQDTLSCRPDKPSPSRKQPCTLYFLFTRTLEILNTGISHFICYSQLMEYMNLESVILKHQILQQCDNANCGTFQID